METIENDVIAAAIARTLPIISESVADSAPAPRETDILEQPVLTACHAQREADDKALSKVAKTVGGYGACMSPEELDDMIPPDNLCSLSLFYKNWTILWPLLGPIVVIIILVYVNPHELAMDCDMNHSLVVELACSATLPAVTIFPRLSLSLGCILLAWRMEHERAYYVLMSHRIMLDFQTGKRFGFWATLILISFFTVSILHFCLKFFAGHPCHAGMAHCDPNKYLINNTFWEMIRNPELINEEQNKSGKEFFNVAFLKFVVPGWICLSTLLGLLALEGELMPLSKMMEAGPQMVYRQLRKYVFVPEPVLRKILKRGLEVGCGNSECCIEDVCKELYESAKAEGCVVLGAPDEAGAFKSIETAELTIAEGIAEVLDIDWWPTAMLLNLNLVQGEGSVNFRRLMGLHWMGTLALILSMMVLATLTDVHSMRLFMGDFAHSHTVIVNLLLVGIEIFVEVTWIYGSLRRAMGLFATSKDLDQV